MRFTTALLFAGAALAAPSTFLAERATCRLCIVSSLGNTCTDVASDSPGTVQDMRVGNVNGEDGTFARCNTFCFSTEAGCEGFQVIGGPNGDYSCSCSK